MLDPIITKSEDVITNVAAEWNGISDHAQISFHVPSAKQKEICSTFNARRWKNFNQDLFDSDLKDSEICQQTCNFDQWSLDEVCDIYHQTLSKLLDKHAPVISRRKRAHVLTPWFDDECRNAKRRARRLKRRYYKSHTAADRASWLAELKSTANFYESKKNEYWRSNIANNSSNPKQLWASLNTVLGRSSNSHAQSSEFGAQNFSNFFTEKTADVARSTASAPPPTINLTATTSFNTLNKMSSIAIEKLISDAASKQCELDPAPTWLIKRSVKLLAPIITYICNRSFTESYLPPSQKQALVHPLLKKSNLDKSELKNYRPISNLTFLSKLIEKAICSQVTMYLESKNILPMSQSAYRCSHSTETALLKVYSDLTDTVDQGEIVLLGLLDLSSAFDTVDYTVLLRKLEMTHGISGDMLN